MRFVVPQFITIEDRLRFGLFSVTFPQLFIGSGTFFICFIIFKLIGGILAVVISGVLVVLAFIIGWVKINNKYVYILLPKLILVLLKSKKYIWKEEVKITTKYIQSPTLEKYIELAETEEISEKIKSIPKTQKSEKKEAPKEKEVANPLVNYIKKAASRGYNPYDPYINFPIPKFPKRRW